MLHSFVVRKTNYECSLLLLGRPEPPSQKDGFGASNIGNISNQKHARRLLYIAEIKARDNFTVRQKPAHSLGFFSAATKFNEQPICNFRFMSKLNLFGQILTNQSGN